MTKKIENNIERPGSAGIYGVEYSDGTEGLEYFDGNTWKVRYNCPVKFWIKQIVAY